MSASNDGTGFGFSLLGESRKDIKELIEWLQRENEALKTELAALKAHLERAVLLEYKEIMEEAGDGMDAVERLRFFCSLALNGQNWLDVEPFFEAVTDEIAALNEPLPLDIPDEDKMFEQIDQWARQSIAHWRRQIRGQQITRGDSGDYHLIMATLRWVKEHPMEPPKVLSAEEVTEAGFYLVRADNINPWVPCIVVRINEEIDELRMLLLGRSEEFSVVGEFIPFQIPEEV